MLSHFWVGREDWAQMGRNLVFPRVKVWSKVSLCPFRPAASLSVYRAIYYAPHVIMFIGIFIGPSLLSLGGTKKSKFTPKKEQKEL